MTTATLYLSQVVDTKEKPSNNYTGYGWEGINYNEKLDTTQISKIIKKQLKKEFPDCKFSVRSKYFSGGSELTISLIETNFEVYNKSYKTDKNGNKYTQDLYDYAQLNYFSFLGDTEDFYNNGMYLTGKVWKVLKRVVQLVNSFRYDDSDSQIDYFDTNFYFHLEVGRWDKPFQVKK